VQKLLVETKVQKIDFRRGEGPLASPAAVDAIGNVRTGLDNSTRDRCYDFKNIFAEIFGEKLAFLTQIKAKLCKIFIKTLDFEKNANFFTENCQKTQKNNIMIYLVQKLAVF
jgi:hypothetical protein